MFKEEFAQLKKANFDGQVMRGMELLARCIEMDQKRLSDLEQERKAVETEMEQKTQLLGKVKESQKRREEKAQKEKKLAGLVPEEAENSRKANGQNGRLPSAKNWRSRSAQNRKAWNC